MRKLLSLLWSLTLLASCALAGPTPPSGAPARGGLVADHLAVGSFATLSDADRARVKGLRVFFQHASVGGNVLDGLKALADRPGTAYDLGFSPSTTDRTSLTAWLASHTGIADYSEGNPGWSAKVADFTANLQDTALAASVQVAMMKFCWIDPDADFPTYRDALLALEAQHPQVRFLWWTMPITTNEDQGTRQAFNTAVRAYARDHGKPLFDLADIESHDPAGNAVRTGGFEALFPGYASDEGHLNETGRERAAQALWVLLSRLR